MCAVTISREYGSGGGEIAARLARRLGWQLVDHELVAQIAAALDETEEEARARDERVHGFVGRMLGSMQWVSPWLGTEATTPPELEAQRHHEALCRIIKAAVDVGHAVVVGRGGQAILRGRRDVLHIRIVAPLDARVAYVARREELSPQAAEARIRQKDRQRATYLQNVEHVRPDNPLLYDLVINTGVLSLDDAVDLICLALARKGARLTVPAADLGPAAGLPPYPGAPGTPAHLQ